MKYKATEKIGIDSCSLFIYKYPDCKVALGRSFEGDWNLPAFSAKADREISSYKIDC